MWFLYNIVILFFYPTGKTCKQKQFSLIIINNTSNLWHSNIYTSVANYFLFGKSIIVLWRKRLFAKALAVINGKHRRFEKLHMRRAILGATPIWLNSCRFEFTCMFCGRYFNYCKSRLQYCFILFDDFIMFHSI